MYVSASSPFSSSLRDISWVTAAPTTSTPPVRWQHWEASRWLTWRWAGGTLCAAVGMGQSTVGGATRLGSWGMEEPHARYLLH